MNTVEDALRKRLEGLTDWIKENAPECNTEQKHLDAGSRERVYWHLGYACALRDALALICSGDISSRN